MNKILVPIDFSDQANQALRIATALARDSGAALLIVHVEPPEVLDEDELYAGIYESDEAVFREMLDRIQPEDPAVKCEHRYLKGEPAKEIIQLAGRTDVDLIVLGTHGRTGLSRLLMGSVAEEVVRGATCPVLTVKLPQAES